MTEAEPVVPDYDGPCVASIVPALLGAGDTAWLPAPVAGARAVVLLVVDGLGWDQIVARSDLHALSGLEGGPITTVVPSTTSAALTSITTGLAPSQHGLIGYRVRVDGAVLNTLSWQVDGRRPPEPRSVQRQTPFRGRDVPVVTKGEFRKTGFTEAHLRGTRFEGWRAVSSLVEQCRSLVASGEPFVYAYYPGVDEVAHAHGLEDEFFAAEVAFVDRLVGDLVDALPEDAAVLVTADHGQVHLTAESWRRLGPLEELVDACSGDARFRYLHARRGAADELLTRAREVHGAHAWVRSRDELLEAGWLGPEPPMVVRRRLGDVVLAAQGSAAFVDPALPHETRLRSAHGSLTAAEMEVPLLAARGTAGAGTVAAGRVAAETVGRAGRTR